VLNAANEAAVEAFLEGRIAFFEISRIVEHTIARHRLKPMPGLDDLLEADRWSRRTARDLMGL
jgi:1-deoxy-D-xylulose-5-phosphate reductoisomerase